MHPPPGRRIAQDMNPNQLARLQDELAGVAYAISVTARTLKDLEKRRAELTALIEKEQQ